MKITITARGNKDERKIRTWDNMNTFLEDVAFWFCSGNTQSKEVGFFEGMCMSAVYGETNNIEFTRSGLTFLITISER